MLLLVFVSCESGGFVVELESPSFFVPNFFLPLFYLGCLSYLLVPMLFVLSVSVYVQAGGATPKKAVCFHLR